MGLQLLDAGKYNTNDSYYRPTWSTRPAKTSLGIAKMKAPLSTNCPFTSRTARDYLPRVSSVPSVSSASSATLENVQHARHHVATRTFDHHDPAHGTATREAAANTTAPPNAELMKDNLEFFSSMREKLGGPHHVAFVSGVPQGYASWVQSVGEVSESGTIDANLGTSGWAIRYS